MAACDGTLAGSTLGAPSLIGNDAGEAYYAFEVAPAQPLLDVTFDSCGSNFDTYLRLVRLVGDAAWEEGTACDDCGSCGTRLQLTTGPRRAGFYLLVIEGYGDAEGDGDIGELDASFV